MRLEYEGKPILGGDQFTIKDSGQRAAFDSGMVRDVDTDKTQYIRLFDGPMAERWAKHLTAGAKKYPDVRPNVPNWTLAEGEAELQRFRASAVRHFVQWLRGETDEDHAAAVMFNINGAEYVKAKQPTPQMTGLSGYASPLVQMPAPKLTDAALKQEPMPGWKCPDCGEYFANADPRGEKSDWRCGQKPKTYVKAA